MSVKLPATSLKPSHRLSRQNLGMFVHTGHDPHPNGSSDSLCHFALVDGAQTGVAAVSDAAHGGDIFGHDGVVLRSQSASRRPTETRLAHLVQIQRVQLQRIKGVRRGTVAFPPLPHFGRAEIMGRVDVSVLPFARLELLQGSAFVVGFLVFVVFLAA